jgi:glycerol-3-phosphate acyltransferase PlsX
MSGSVSRLRVAVDAMGGDLGPAVVVEGAVAACRDLDLGIRVVGPRQVVSQEMAGQRVAGLDIEAVDAPDAIGMAERVTRSTLKRRSSIQVGMELVRDGQAQAFFSAGNTAACWTIAKQVLGTIEAVERPALAAVMPTPGGRTVLIDVGANANCKARQLEQFAVMGTAYSRRVFGTTEPRVGLMSIGEEEGKGNELTKEVHEALKGSHLNFIGNVEGHDVFSDRADVVVMDGFTGNVVLKASEAMAVAIMRLMREELQRSRPRRLGAWLAKHAFKGVQRRLDAAEYGGVPLLGVCGCCFIGHGRSTAAAIRQGIKAAADFFARGVNDELAEELVALAARRRVAQAG